ncbi:hypothetical protein ACKI16_29310 [Streptomyces scabiei]|uniref:hypothetical protein n=1 Tax=Streptomyces scabiei TaxID=1930 RepID=UPI0038F74813
MPCATIRACLSGVDGINYSPATGVIRADINTGCGLTGNGAAATPLTVAVGAWPFACDLEDNAGAVYCDADGVLRSPPPPRATFVQSQVNQSYPSLAVPAGFDNVIETRNLNIVNPDPCRAAFVICEVEVDVDFDLPANSGAAYGITTDEMSYFANRGATAATDVHTQTTKVFNRSIAAGGVLVEPLDITMGRGSGGATYNRIQSFMRAFVFNLS